MASTLRHCGHIPVNSNNTKHCSGVCSTSIHLSEPQERTIHGKTGVLHGYCSRETSSQHTYYMICYFNVHSKAEISQLNLPVCAVHIGPTVLGPILFVWNTVLVLFIYVYTCIYCKRLHNAAAVFV